MYQDNVSYCYPVFPSTPFYTCQYIPGVGCMFSPHDAGYQDTTMFGNIAKGSIPLRKNQRCFNFGQSGARLLTITTLSHNYYYYCSNGYIHPQAVQKLSRTVKHRCGDTDGLDFVFVFGHRKQYCSLPLFPTISRSSSNSVSCFVRPP